MIFGQQEVVIVVRTGTNITPIRYRPVLAGYHTNSGLSDLSFQSPRIGHVEGNTHARAASTSAKRTRVKARGRGGAS